MFVVVSEDQFTILPMAQDHKRVGDGDKGPNTGGMGSYSPLPQLKKEDRQRMIDEIVKPTMNGLVQGNYHYCGILYIGLMMTENDQRSLNITFAWVTLKLKLSYLELKMILRK